MIFDFWTPKETDTDRGLKFMRDFHNYATLNHSANYRISFTELENFYGKGFALTLGRAINATDEISDSEIEWAAEFLADKTQGRLPPDQAEWISALAKANESVFSHGWEYLTGGVKDAAVTVGDTGKSVYKGIIGGAKEVVGDAGGILASGLSGLSTPLLLVGGLAIVLIFVAGKSGAVRVTRAI